MKPGQIQAYRWARHQSLDNEVGYPNSNESSIKYSTPRVIRWSRPTGIEKLL